MLHCRVCLTRTAIAPAAGRSVRSKATLPVDTVSVRVSRPIAHRHHAARCSPITLQRSTIPVSTDSVAPPSSKPTHGNVHSKNPQRSISPASQAALHPLRGATPNQKGCNADGSGAVPPRQEQKRAALCQQLDNVARAVPRSCRKLGGAPRCPPSSDTTDQRTVSIPHQVVTWRGRCSEELRH